MCVPGLGRIAFHFDLYVHQRDYFCDTKVGLLAANTLTGIANKGEKICLLTLLYICI